MASRDSDQAFAARMIREARALREAAEAAWLPAVRAQLMSRVVECENAATLGDPHPFDRDAVEPLRSATLSRKAGEGQARAARQGEGQAMSVDQVVAAATHSWAEGAGGVIALFDERGVTRSWCLGLADIESRRLWSLDTPTRLASISKHVTAAATLALGLNGRLGDHLPELTGGTAATTMARALTMTSGVPDLGESLGLGGVPSSSNVGAERLLALAARTPHLNFPAGGEVSYSNTNFRLAQHAVERAAGTSLRDWLRTQFFAPLGLASFDLPDDQREVVPGLASGYWQDASCTRRGTYGLHYSGSGGMVASARDLAAWLAALRRGDGPLAGLLGPLAEAGRLEDGMPVAYARGLMLHALAGRSVLGHGGSLPGYKNHFLLDPDAGIGVVVLSNREETEAQPLALAVLAAELGLAHAAPRPERIPTGLFVDPESGDTLELAHGPRGPTAAFLGAEEKLFLAEDGAWCSHAPHLPLRIEPANADAASLVARIGLGPTRGWRRGGGEIDGDVVGRFRCEALDACHEIARHDGGFAIRFGGGPVPDRWCALRPGIGDCHATVMPSAGPWRHRPALRFVREGGPIAGFILSSNRSRGWRFERARA